MLKFSLLDIYYLRTPQELHDKYNVKTTFKFFILIIRTEVRYVVLT